MMILLGEFGHIKSPWDNHNRCIKCSSCSRESTCCSCSSWSDKTWKLAEERRTYASRKWVMAKKKKRSQKVMSDSSDEEKLDHHPTWPCCPGEDPSRWQLQKYLYPEEYVHRSPATGQSPNGQEDITDWPPVTGSRSNGHYTRIFKSVNHQSPSIQPPVIGLRKSQHRGKSPVIRLYINLHLVRLKCHGHGVH